MHYAGKVTTFLNFRFCILDPIIKIIYSELKLNWIKNHIVVNFKTQIMNFIGLQDWVFIYLSIIQTKYKGLETNE